MTNTRRRPRWIYDQGDEPDYRFSLANERTLLAWIRTSLALVGGGVAVQALETGLTEPFESLVGYGLLMLGSVCSVAAWTRWARSERAMRRREPLPSALLTMVLCGVVLALSLAVLAAVR